MTFYIVSLKTLIALLNGMVDSGSTSYSSFKRDNIQWALSTCDDLLKKLEKKNNETNDF